MNENKNMAAIAIAALAAVNGEEGAVIIRDDGRVEVLFSRNYGIWLEMNLQVAEGFMIDCFEGRWHSSEATTCSELDFGEGILHVAAEVLKFIDHVPPGNIEDMGGVDVLARAAWVIHRAQAYCR